MVLTQRPHKYECTASSLMFLHCVVRSECTVLAALSVCLSVCLSELCNRWVDFDET
jgi:hypothetical protein